jgi:hypothetical protein
MEGNGCASPLRAPPTKGPRRSNLVYSTMAYAHGGLALLGVDLHEVGDLLSLTNFLVQLHISMEAPKRHLTNLGDTTLQKVIDVVLMMNSLLLCFK